MKRNPAGTEAPFTREAARTEPGTGKRAAGRAGNTAQGYMPGWNGRFLIAFPDKSPVYGTLPVIRYLQKRKNENRKRLCYRKWFERKERIGMKGYYVGEGYMGPYKSLLKMLTNHCMRR